MRQVLEDDNDVGDGDLFIPVYSVLGFEYELRTHKNTI